jgi:hypothetical protein
VELDDSEAVVDVVVLLLVVAGLPLVVVAEADPDHALDRQFAEA